MPEPVKLYSGATFSPGEVLMVNRKMRDKATGRKFDWKFFLVVTGQKRDNVAGWVMGASRGYYVDNEMHLSLNHSDAEIHHLAPDEWPDGVFAFRLALIMQRKLENL